MLVPAENIWGQFGVSTAPFWELYQEVTRRMTRNIGRLEGDEQAWFMYLMRGFEEKYRAWEYDPTVRSYLERVDAASERGGRVLRVIGHAYLHVAYDLPRTIADSLTHFTVPRERAEDIFEWPSQDFLDVFEDCSRRHSIFGWRGTLLCAAYHLSGKKSLAAVRNQAIWLLMLRKDAWTNGLRLANSGPDRQSEDERLWWAFDTITRSLINRHRAAQWIAGLPSPRVFYHELRKQDRTAEHLSKQDQKEDLRNLL